MLTDLSAESAALDSLVADPAVDWATMTPAPGWTISHQIGHLAWTDKIGATAILEPDLFAGYANAFAQRSGLVDDMAAELAALPPQQLRRVWRDGRDAFQTALRGLPAGARIGWLGPAMGAGTMASARIMETWAHGEDVAAALGVRRAPTDRLRHVADLGVRTREFAFRQRGLAPPAEPFRVELTGPSGDAWTWGPPDAGQRVTGPALDFCLLVVRRRHPEDLAVLAEGAQAQQWLTIAQAFAGPAGPDIARPE